MNPPASPVVVLNYRNEDYHNELSNSISNQTSKSINRQSTTPAVFSDFKNFFLRKY